MGLFRNKARADTRQQQPGAPAAVAGNQEAVAKRQEVADEPDGHDLSTPPTVPAPDPGSSATLMDPPSTTVADADEDTIRTMFFALADICKEAGLLFDRCFEKAESIDKAAAVVRTGYVNGNPANEASIRDHASMAEKWEEELVALLHDLRALSTMGRLMGRDFRVAAGAPSGDWQSALRWCFEHGIDSGAVKSMVDDRTYVMADFGLTKASFFEQSDKLYAMATSGQL